MDDHVPGKSKDFARFWRLPGGDCELLSARYSTQTFGRHSHDRYALGVISEGVEKLYYRGAYHWGRAGTLVSITPGEIHDGLPGHEQGWMYRMLYIDPTWVERMVFRGRYPAGHIHLFEQALSLDLEFARLFVQQHHTLEHSDSNLERESVLLELVTQLFERGGAPTSTFASSEKTTVRVIKKKLEEEFDSNITLDELAQLAGLDPLYLIRVFKKNVGISPHSYLIQKRITEVQRLLRTGVSLTEASQACGFFDQSHMTRAFKKVVGVTPGSFRNTGA